MSLSGLAVGPVPSMPAGAPAMAGRASVTPIADDGPRQAVAAHPAG